jgi:hypothetical protein
MITFLTMYSGSLCNVTKVPTASNISYFVHALQDHRRKLVRLLEFISFDPKSVIVMPLENFKKDPPGLWLIIQNSLSFSWLKNCLDQHDPSRKNIKTTNDIFSYILSSSSRIKRLLRSRLRINTSADQQRKDASAARYPARPNIHAITEANYTEDPVIELDPSSPDVLIPPDEEYSYQDEAEAVVSVSYDNDEVMDDFNYDNRAVLYSDLDQKSYIQYAHETYFYPNQDPASFSAIATSSVTPVNKKALPCFKFAKQNCDLGDSCPYSHKKEKITEYLNSHHAGVTHSKKAVHDKNKETVTSQHILYYCTYYSVSFTCTVHCTYFIYCTLYTLYMFPVSLFPMLRFHLQHLFTLTCSDLTHIHLVFLRYIHIVSFIIS